MKEELKLSTEGINILFSHFSIDSALLRQAVYATLRLGIYFNLSDYIKEKVNNGANMTTL
jgi:hypothetical protein